MHVVGQEREVDGHCQPLASQQEEDSQGCMQQVLGQHQRVQAAALVDGVLVVSLQLVKGNYLLV